MPKILIVGLGAMGGAIARELSKENTYEILGCDTNQQTLHNAINMRFITQTVVVTDLNIIAVDLIILATPPKITKQILSQLTTTTLIMDIASIKIPIMQSAQHLPHFVGGHPMVGTDKTGLIGHSAVHYDQRYFFLMGQFADIQMIQRLLAPLKSHFIVTDPILHDQQVALTSDLPHLVAYALVQTLQTDATLNSLAYVGNGFKDTTRIAQANSQLWADILCQNKQAVHQSLQSFITVLRELDTKMMTDNQAALEQQLQLIQTFRSSLL